MKQKLRSTSMLLMVILLIRAIFQFITLFRLKAIGLGFILVLIFAILYSVSLVGIYKKQKWAIFLAIFIGIVDLIIALINGGAASVGAGVIDVSILFLAYKEYQNYES